jgi:hypothetical protein
MRAYERVFGDPFERALKRVACLPTPRVLFYWNRGLGDIAMGLVPLFEKLRAANPRVRIEVLTRADLADGFALAGVDTIHVAPGLARGERDGFARHRAACAELSSGHFEIVFAAPDPTRWLAHLLPATTPRLVFPPAWDALHAEIPGILPGRTLIVAHASAETGQFYGYTKDWPTTHWHELFARYRDHEDIQWLLIGHVPTPDYAYANVLDLRGRTTLPQVLSLLRHRARALVAIDSGILCLVWCLAADFDLDVISLWADPHQGILKLGLPAPNHRLVHAPLLGANQLTANIPVFAVEEALARVLGTHTP